MNEFYVLKEEIDNTNIYKTIGYFRTEKEAYDYGDFVTMMSNTRNRRVEKVRFYDKQNLFAFYRIKEESSGYSIQFMDCFTEEREDVIFSANDYTIISSVSVPYGEPKDMEISALEKYRKLKTEKNLSILFKDRT